MLWYREKSLPEEFGSVTVKALEASDVNPGSLLFLESPEETAVALLLACGLLLQGWNPLESPGAPSDRTWEEEDVGSPILLQVAASIASGVLPSLGSSCGEENTNFHISYDAPEN